MKVPASQHEALGLTWSSQGYLSIFGRGAKLFYAPRSLDAINSTLIDCSIYAGLMTINPLSPNIKLQIVRKAEARGVEQLSGATNPILAFRTRGPRIDSCPPTIICLVNSLGNHGQTRSSIYSDAAICMIQSGVSTTSSPSRAPRHAKSPPTALSKSPTIL